MKINRILCLAAALCGLLAAGCDTDIESIDRRTETPDGSALYAEYLKALVAYKSSEHHIVYARMENAPQQSTSPKDFMRALPDSLDYVALMRPLSKFDREDLPSVQAKGTKVLAAADCSDPTQAAGALDAALAEAARCGLDGVALVFDGPVTDDARTSLAALAAKLATLDGKTVVFDGNPLTVAAADRDRYDFFVYDTSLSESVSALGRDVDYLTDYAGIPARKLLLAAAPSATIIDRQLDAQPALSVVPECVLSFGPLAGLAVHDVTEDYYDPLTNYRQTRLAISVLNK